MTRLLAWAVRGVAGAALLFLGLLLAWALESRTMSPLRVWHTATLGAEFTARDATPETSLGDYLRREDLVFHQLEEEVYDRIEPTPELALCRYLAGGPQDPGTWSRDWNRTFELVPEAPRGGALLLHGLTDAPYSLRRVGELLRERGFYVLGLRLPGHGTIPGALRSVRWEDWVAASRIGARHVRERVGSERPFVVAGYSNGGALTIKYALDSLSDESLPRPDRLLLFSPEVGIEPLAFLADAYEILTVLPYFAQFAWLSIEPEYDPFKYNSFAKNAAQQAWELTHEIHDQIDRAHDSGRLRDFPASLAFLSWTDSTVETSATIHRLYDQLEAEDGELVVFDVNRAAALVPFLAEAEGTALESLTARSDLPYRLTVVENVGRDSERVAERTKAPRTRAMRTTELPWTWPAGVYSLSHVAIPFSPDDPVYGSAAGAGPPGDGGYAGLPLGSLEPRGETRVLVPSLGQLMRLRHNPFFAYVVRRTAGAVDELLVRSIHSHDGKG